MAKKMITVTQVHPERALRMEHDGARPVVDRGSGARPRISADPLVLAIIEKIDSSAALWPRKINYIFSGPH